MKYALLLLLLSACNVTNELSPFPCPKDGHCPSELECENRMCRLKCTAVGTCPNDGLCVDGGCYDACGPTNACTHGTCSRAGKCVEGTCANSADCAGTLCCKDACVDEKTDDLNCGACGAACTGDTSCSGGKCECPASASLKCGDKCFAAATSKENCGTCGTACAGNANCVGSVCGCAPGSTYVAGNGCFDLQNDSANCGSKGQACGTRKHCVAGACVCDPSANFASSTDSLNCHTCGNDCVGGSCSSGSCSVVMVNGNVATSDERVMDLAQDSTHVYLAVATTRPPSLFGGKVLKQAKSGGARSIVFNDSDPVWGVAVTETLIYFADGYRSASLTYAQDGAIYSCPKAGNCTSASFVASNAMRPNEPRPLSVVGSDVVWADGASGMTPECGPINENDTQPCPFPAGPGLIAWHHPSGPYPTISPITRPSTPAVMSGKIYFASSESGAQVFQCAFPDCTSPAALPSFPVTEGIGDIVATSSALYFAERRAAANTFRMWRCNLDGSGCAQSTDVSTTGFGAYDADEDSVYWATATNLMRFSGQTLASSVFVNEVASRVLVDADAVYWVTGTALRKRGKEY